MNTPEIPEPQNEFGMSRTEKTLAIISSMVFVVGSMVDVVYHARERQALQNSKAAEGKKG